MMMMILLIIITKILTNSDKLFNLFLFECDNYLNVKIYNPFYFNICNNKTLKIKWMNAKRYFRNHKISLNCLFIYDL